MTSRFALHVTTTRLTIRASHAHAHGSSTHATRIRRYRVSKTRTRVGADSISTELFSQATSATSGHFALESNALPRIARVGEMILVREKFSDKRGSSPLRVHKHPFDASIPFTCALRGRTRINANFPVYLDYFYRFIENSIKADRRRWISLGRYSNAATFRPYKTRVTRVVRFVSLTRQSQTSSRELHSSAPSSFTFSTLQRVPTFPRAE